MASAGNDHRLGANEAPPAIISMFLGDELSEILEAIADGSSYVGKEKTEMEIGVKVLPHFFRDNTDRNRTSPFAFTGNKFEFRSVGSTFSIAGPNVVLNTIVADELQQFADELEASEYFPETVAKIIRRTVCEHKRILFNGNNYAPEWVAEAEKRGLLNLRTTPDALPYFIRQENIDLFTRHGVFSKTEMLSRYEILMENYAKILHIEAMTMLDMAKKDILPAALKSAADLAGAILEKEKAGLTAKTERALGAKISALADSLSAHIEALEAAAEAEEACAEAPEAAAFARDKILPAMADLRADADALEMLVPKKDWPFPTYGDLLFSVQ